MSDARPEARWSWGGPARLPVALSGLLAVFAAALFTLVVIGSGIDDQQIAQADPATDQDTQPPPQEVAAATPPPEPTPPQPTPAEAAPEPAVPEPGDDPATEGPTPNNA